MTQHSHSISANLECRSEMFCTRLAANAGPKKVAKNRHLVFFLVRVCGTVYKHPSDRTLTRDSLSGY